MRMGKKKQPTYRIVAADSRSPRNGRFIEIIGTYEPRKDPSGIEVDGGKAVEWLMKGAKASGTVRKLLEHAGTWDEFRQQRPEKPKKAGRKRKEKAVKKSAKKVAKKAPAKGVKKAAAKEAAAARVESEEATEAASEGSPVAKENPDADAGEAEASAGVEQTETGVTEGAEQADDAPAEAG
jgi:small subunit ribosomal protein S16